MKICIVCSPGGHFVEMRRLMSAFEGKDHFFVTRRRRTLVRHLSHRSALGDAGHIGVIMTTDFDPSRGICNLGFEVKRSIKGGPWRRFSGKGALSSSSGRVVVWNVGGRVKHTAP